MDGNSEKLRVHAQDLIQEEQAIFGEKKKFQTKIQKKEKGTKKL